MSIAELGKTRDLPIVMQSELAECGLACLAMISSFFGFLVDLRDLRRRFSVSTQGTTLKQLADIAGRINLSHRALRLDMEDLPRLQLPCVVHWDMSHYVVLKEVGRSHAVIHDPATGIRRLRLDEFAQHFTGVALEFTPTSSFKAEDVRQRLRLRDLIASVRGLKRSLLAVLAMSIVLQVLAIVSPLYLQLVVDDAVLSQNQSLLTVLLIGFLLFVALEIVFNLVRDLVLLTISSKLQLQISSSLFKHLLCLPTSFFESRHIGDIVSRFGSLDEIRRICTVTLLAGIVDGLLAVVVLAVLFLYNVKLALFVTGVVAIYLFVRSVLYIAYRRRTEENIRDVALHDSHFIETIRAIRSLKIFSRETERESEWKNLFIRKLNSEIRVGRLQASFSAINNSLFGLEGALSVYFAALFVLSGSMTIGMLFAFISLKNRFVQSAEGLIRGILDARMLTLHLDRVSDIALAEAEPVPLVPPTRTADTRRVELEVVDLAYCYPGSSDHAFEGVSFRVEPGEILAIVGPSGAGKTTLLKCVMGLLEPTGGHVLTNGVYTTGNASYRQSFAAVMQDDVLLSGTILENIACFEQPVDRERVIRAATLAVVHDRIMQLPMKYNTLVGDMGSSLSGGEKQRIFLARALYSEPALLFLDEASSHLDLATEKQVRQNLASLGVTQIVVAHRRASIENADTILVLGGSSQRSGHRLLDRDQSHLRGRS